MKFGGRARPSQDIFDEAMAFLDSCEPEHLQIINVRTRQLQASGHGATDHGREVIDIASQHAAGAGASAGHINQPLVPAAAGGIAGGAAAGGIAGGVAPMAPRKRATLDPETVLQIFFTRDDPSSCYAWATAQGVTHKAVRDVWNLRTWRE